MQFLSFFSERTSQLKSWTTRELQDIEGFSAQNVSQLIILPVIMERGKLHISNYNVAQRISYINKKLHKNVFPYLTISRT